jgi:hypothetical protein
VFSRRRWCAGCSSQWGPTQPYRSRRTAVGPRVAGVSTTRVRRSGSHWRPAILDCVRESIGDLRGGCRSDWACVARGPATLIGPIPLDRAEQAPRPAHADRAGVPAGTVASWLRAGKRAATALIGRATHVAGHAVRVHRPLARHLGSDLAEALDALGSAAAAFACAAIPALTLPARPGQTGIDYLRLIAAKHHQNLCTWLHVADRPVLCPRPSPGTWST